jgi:hypothetical protein
MNRRKIIFLVTMVLSAAGFVVDRFILGEPAVAQAKSPRAKTKAVAAEPISDDNTVVDPSLNYLDKLDDMHPAGGRDVFSMSHEMISYYKSADETQEAGAKQLGPRPGSGEEFELNHHLEGTYMGPQNWMAVINGEVVRPGDQIDDFRVTRIATFRVELRSGTERAVLALPKPGTLPPDARGAKGKPPAKVQPRSK